MQLLVLGKPVDQNEHHSIICLIARIRNAHPDNQRMYMEGQCYNFSLILREVWNHAEIYYSMIEGHVYSKINGRMYDIRGCNHTPPSDIELLCHQRGDKPHRWGLRDDRRLSDAGSVDG